MAVWISNQRPVRVTAIDVFTKESLVTGFVGSIKNAIIKCVTYNDTVNADEAFKTESPDASKIFIERRINAQLVFDPVMAKQFANWLNEQVVLYESFYGKVMVPKDLLKNPPREREEILQEQDLERQKGEISKKSNDFISWAQPPNNAQ